MVKMCNLMYDKSSPVIREECIATVYCREYFCLLHVPLAAQSPQQSNYSAIGMLHPHCSATGILYVTLCSLIHSSPPKKICAFPNCRYYSPKFPLKHLKNENCLHFYLCPDRNFKFHLCPASSYCVFLSLLKLPRNHYAKY